MADGEVSTMLSACLLVMLIVFSLLFEFFLHRLEHWVQNRHQHLFGVLRVLYRELMILGLVSFCFIVYQLTADPSGDTVLSFEFAHIFIFLLAIFYTAIVMCTMFLSSSLSSRWKRMERMDLVQYLSVRDNYAQMKAVVSRRGMFWWFPNIASLYKFTGLHEIMTFHDIRFQFIYFRDLPDKFRFASFLRKIKAKTFVNLVDSHWSLWVIFLAIVLFDILYHFLTDASEKVDHSTRLFKAIASTFRAGVKDESGIKPDGQASKGESLFDSIYTICFAVVLSVFVQVLAWKIRDVYWKLMKNPRTYYEGVDTNAMMEELEKLTNDEQKNRRHRIQSRRARANAVRPHSSADSGAEADDEDDGDRANDKASFETRGTIQPPVIRHSLDRSKVSQSSSVNDLKALEAGATTSKAFEHHSLDMPSQDQPSHMPISPARPSATFDPASSLARSAVEAARQKREQQNRWQVQITEPPRDKLSSLKKKLGLKEHRLPPRQFSDRVTSDGAELQNRSPIESTRVSLDSKATGRDSTRVSVELAISMNREELSSYFEEKQNASDQVSPSAAQSESFSTPSDHETTNFHGPVQIDLNKRIGSGNADGKSTEIWDDAPLEGEQKIQRQKTVTNATILKNFEAHHNGRQRTPPSYPKLLKKLIPRLSRVASPLEKLFWFGSHRFFFWCVEFVLFFSTVLLASSTARISLSAVKGRHIDAIQVVSLALSAFNLIIVLSRIAVIMKRYIFILHNASLIPEVVALETIERMQSKSAEGAGQFVVRGNMSGTGIETDQDDEGDDEDFDSELGNSQQSRMGQYFRSHVEEGTMSGINAGKTEKSSERSRSGSRTQYVFQIFRKRTRIDAESSRRRRLQLPFGIGRSNDTPDGNNMV